MNDRVAKRSQPDECGELHQTGTAGVNGQQRWEWCKRPVICALYPRSFAEGSGRRGWEWHVPAGQDGYSAFDGQAHADWRHPEGQAAIDESMRFWLDGGESPSPCRPAWHRR